ncbi:LysR substrate-binding domain-containing protein [Actinacidiphila glaucinigra]|uniref:LysR substrate-binding domain-containing protein n=1 Tax=Actinacidiphila glaucinigra TaxID=235986 RepID=UPI00386FB7A1
MEGDARAQDAEDETATEDRSVIAIPPVPVTNSATAEGFVAAGLGVSLLPRAALAHHHPGVVVRKVRGPEPVRAVHAAMR